MKWLILAIFAEVSVLLCLIFTFDGALHSLQSARLTWDHVAVVMVYAYVRVEFSRKRIARPSTMLRAVPSTVEGRQSVPARVPIR
jgi:hypothetical protein